MSGKVIVITGASDGIGAVAARDLRAAGNTVVVIGRSPNKTRAIATAIDAPFYVADYSDLSQVRTLAAQLRRDLPRIDVLANNAGGIFPTRTTTVDGHEITMQVNHLAPFMLTYLLLDLLLASRASVINTASVAHRMFSNFNIDDIESEKSFSPLVAYGNSKLENILFTRELDKRFHSQELSSACFHPGVVATNFAHDSHGPMRLAYHTPIRRLFTVSPQRGADTLVWLASTTPEVDWQSGGYYIRRRLSTSLDKKAVDPSNQRRLWEMSVAMVEASSSN